MNILTYITQLISTARYPVVFLCFFIDGSSTNFIASTLAATGILNIWIICIAAIVIELIVDMFYFLLGRKLSNSKFVKKNLNSSKSEFFKTLDNSYKAHPGTTLMLVKFAGPLAIPGLLYMGKVKALSIVNFLKYAFIVAGSRAALLSFLGYMVGKGLTQYVHIYNGLKTFGIILIVIIVIAVIYKIYEEKIEEWFLSIFKKIK
jgi:membrane protein DedA with SNARE-associated domain